ncbi:alpha-L-rhamnosidase [Catalinimonas alkaloidigena]|uniref:Alpha-L-rhamnosidase n=1 Tax=Catalinimonas alkaloidigena TaxID=1075417 RepID=A0A1G9PBB4_9BACT|nr:glycosyl hydrolase [Catalinimonas alkaloidigena]SDL96039.1 alpha-L-rhamnosidase [Catalinimonas alkaloidigena]
MRNFIRLAGFLCLLGGSPSGWAQSTSDGWPERTATHRPWTRWWWMGNAVDPANLDTLLTRYAAAGFGGVEVTPIYGAMGYEDRYLPYLSPTWMDALRFSAQKAEAVGMRLDMNLGTGWPFGGPQIQPEHAASQLVMQTYDVRGGKKWTHSLQVDDPKQRELGATLQAVVAYGDGGEVVDLTDQVSDAGQLTWKPKRGQWKVYAAFAGHTRQQVKRAAPGGEGYTMNHFSEEALQTYLHRFDTAFGAQPPNVRAYFNDSYEVYNADWSPNLLDAFRQRRGYDLALHLRELVSDDSTETLARLKSDYRETLSELLLENFTRPWTGWIHGKGGLSKNQAHGSPGNLLDLYGAVDIPECETFGSSYFPIPGLRRDSADVRNVDPDPIFLKFASSPAHVLGKPLVSCEAFTWLAEHFKVAPSQCKPEVEQTFLAGVNHVFYHGTTYSPLVGDQAAPWPGWLFYASTNFAPSNSWWPQVQGLNQYIARCQSVLQAGRPDNELLVYWPIYDVWHDAHGMEYQIGVHDVDEWLHPTPFYQLARQLTDRGYSLDFASDLQLEQARVVNGNVRVADGGGDYAVLVLPKSEHLPVETFEQAMRLAREGATVVLQALPQEVPGLHQLDERRQQLQQRVRELSFTAGTNGVQEAQVGEGRVVLTAQVESTLPTLGLNRETLTDLGLKFIRRKIDGGTYYYVVNHTPDAVNQVVTLTTAAQAVTMLDPQSGAYGTVPVQTGGQGTQVRLQLAPGEAMILRTADQPRGDAPVWAYVTETGTAQPLNGPWTLRFTEGGPEQPKDQSLSSLMSWTELNDPDAGRFSGCAEYSTTFEWSPEEGVDDYRLQLGNVRESARVWLNGEEVGVLWSLPFQARVGPFLKKGTNTLKIEVCNLMANRIRDMDRRGVEWKKYHEINFVNINYKSFDASDWAPQPSGLLGPVTLQPLRHTPNHP